jgi:hypothetical protein
VGRLRVVVAGALANKPANGGEAWVRMSWVRGLERLGCDVTFVEQIEGGFCTDDEGRPAPLASSANLRWFREVTGAFGLGAKAMLLSDTGEADGIPLREMLDVAVAADLLVNISGHLSHEKLKGVFRNRAYVDIDPGFTQFWHDDGNRAARLAGHERYFTIGENIGSSDCPIPTGGLVWTPTRQPVVLADWPVVAPPLADDPWFTTVATWRGPFGPIERDRRRFGLKAHEFRKYVTMPQLVPAQFGAALAIHPCEQSDIELLHHHGWHLADPRSAAGTPEEFRRFVVASGAEFSVAQGIYVETVSGWFSDRTTRYLATGRPALVQDTGFSRRIPSGKGLVAFSTLAEAVQGARAILDDYDAHATAARGVAEAYFDSDVILERFLDQCEVG